MAETVENLLLDTQTWIRFILGDEQLAPELRERIEQAAAGGGLFLSIISVWEAAQYIAQQRLAVKKPSAAWIKEALDASGVQVVPLSADIAVESSQLPDSMKHTQPLTKILIATARDIGAKLVIDQASHQSAENAFNSRYVSVVAA